MARRMFSDEITDTDAFLDMPSGSQLLYFRLGMLADDDGFISNTKLAMRAIGASEDELKILFAKKFLLPFENGICVIKHWRINNYIRKQYYKETRYTKERSMLRIKENGAYTFNLEGSIALPAGHFTTKENVKNGAVDGASTDGRHRIGKDRIGKDRILPTKSVEKEFEYDLLFIEFWSAYPKKIAKGQAYKSWQKMKPKASRTLVDTIIASIEDHIKLDQWKKEHGQFIPYPSTFINQRGWEDELKSTSGEGRHSKYSTVAVHKA